MTAITSSFVASLELGRHWALERACFPAIGSVDPVVAAAARPIAIIDVGDGSGSFKHRLFHRRPDYKVPRWSYCPPPGDRLHGAHSAEVAGVIAGACDAEIIVYDIGTTDGWDKDLFVMALRQILTLNPKPAVVNISVGWPDGWAEADDAIQDCLDSDISIVVAVGDDGAFTAIDWYPATRPDVIAVAGTDRHDLQLPDSDSGDHVWIAAPGEDIPTVVNEEDLGTRNGTSFATALVAAAVWLALLANGDLKPADIRNRLAETADRLDSYAGWNSCTGWGRINVTKAIR